MVEQLDEQDLRIARIFGLEDEVPIVEVETIEFYRDYLKQNLKLPIQLTGIEDFPWEEFYIIGPGCREEHKLLRETRPSYLDTHDLLSFDDEIEADLKLYVNLQRVTDSKKFVLPLEDLKATSKRSKNYELLHDFSVWIVNGRLQ